VVVLAVVAPCPCSRGLHRQKILGLPGPAHDPSGPAPPVVSKNVQARSVLALQFYYQLLGAYVKKTENQRCTAGE